MRHARCALHVAWRKQSPLLLSRAQVDEGPAAGDLSPCRVGRPLKVPPSISTTIVFLSVCRYPHTCGANYMTYTLWAGVTNTAVTANGVLASTFLLYSVGLGAGSIAAAGAMNWVLKDGIGQLGTLVFGKIIAHNFDIHSKSW